MRYISLFSGVEAATVAWRDLDGFEPVAFCEIDKFPSAVLAYRFPDVPNLGDITKVDWKEVLEEHGAIDLIVGGSPCQSFSIAGGRESLDGESALCFEYWRAVRDVRPTWFLWENVPGVLSTRDNAFGQFVGALEELGYSMAWRTLDAQFFGVAQRRRRVFLVGCTRGGGASAAVLFEPESVSGNTQSSKQKRESLTRAAEKRAGSGGFKFHQGANAGSVGYVDEQSPTLTSDWHQPAVMAFDTTQITNPDNNAHPEFGKPCHTLNAKAHTPTICLQTDHMGQNGTNTTVDICKTLDCASQTPVVCVSDDQAHSAIDVEMSGSLKVGGGCAVNSAGTNYVNALCARDYKGIGNQDIGDGKLICQKLTS